MEVKIHLNNPNTLLQQLPESIWPDITCLKVTGYIGRKDFEEVLDNLCWTEGECIDGCWDDFVQAENQPYHLRILDLGEATYVDGDNLPEFGYYPQIETFVLPQGITSTLDGDIIETSFVHSQHLKTLVLPDGLETLGGFSDCPNLTDIRIPDSVKVIEDNAFTYCKSISNIVISRNVESIIGNPFAGCNIEKFEVDIENPYYISKDGVIFSRDLKTLVAFPSSYKSDKYEIPNSVRIIGYDSFVSSQIKQVFIPGIVETIADYAFSYSSLTEVSIPDSVIMIGDGAFKNCAWLTKISIGSGISHLPEQLFTDCDALKHLEIPGNVKTIHYNAVAWTAGLEEIIFHSGVEKIIGDGLLLIGKTRLQKVILPDTLNDIVGGAFNYANNYNVFQIAEDNKTYKLIDGVLHSADGKILVSVPNRQRKKYIVPHGVSIIDSAAFFDHYNLEEIILPDTIEDICYRAFQGCDKLTKLYLPPSIKRIDIDALWADNLKQIFLARHTPPEMYGSIRESEWRFKDVNVYVPDQSVKLYQQSPGWRYFRIQPCSKLPKS